MRKEKIQILAEKLFLVMSSEPERFFRIGALYDELNGALPGRLSMRAVEKAVLQLSDAQRISIAWGNHGVPSYRVINPKS